MTLVEDDRWFFQSLHLTTAGESVNDLTRNAEVTVDGKKKPAAEVVDSGYMAMYHPPSADLSGCLHPLWAVIDWHRLSKKGRKQVEEAMPYILNLEAKEMYAAPKRAIIESMLIWAPHTRVVLLEGLRGPLIPATAEKKRRSRQELLKLYGEEGDLDFSEIQEFDPLWEGVDNAEAIDDFLARLDAFLKRVVHTPPTNILAVPEKSLIMCLLQHLMPQLYELPSDAMPPQLLLQSFDSCVIHSIILGYQVGTKDIHQIKAFYIDPELQELLRSTGEEQWVKWHVRTDVDNRAQIHRYIDGFLQRAGGSVRMQERQVAVLLQDGGMPAANHRRAVPVVACHVDPRTGMRYATFREYLLLLLLMKPGINLQAPLWRVKMAQFIFECFDADGDNVLSRSELHDLFAKVLESRHAVPNFTTEAIEHHLVNYLGKDVLRYGCSKAYFIEAIEKGDLVMGNEVLMRTSINHLGTDPYPQSNMPRDPIVRPIYRSLSPPPPPPQDKGFVQQLLSLTDTIFRRRPSQDLNQGEKLAKQLLVGAREGVMLADIGVPMIDKAMAAHTFRLASDTSLARCPIDQDVAEAFSSCGFLDWKLPGHGPDGADISAKLIPWRTDGDGDCLLHSLSVGMWGVHDRQTLLRDLLSNWVTNAGLVKEIYFKGEHRDDDVLSEVIGTIEPRSRQQLEKDYHEQIVLPACNPKAYLGRFHLFLLAHILRRPILVYTHVIQKTASGKHTPENMCGIYLPVLVPEEDRFRIPLTIAYKPAHFTALVGIEDQTRRVPLMEIGGDWLPIPYISLQEEGATSIADLLSRYLCIENYRATKDRTYYFAGYVAHQLTMAVETWQIRELTL